jgi:pimeloyl-ACP methyl ester carboxylesterase
MTNIGNRIIRGASAFAFALAALVGCGTRLDSHLVELDGRAVEVVTGGSGAASVVFESGLGNDWASWDATAAEVSTGARVFAYSRPGYGKSDPATTPRDPAHIVEELRALLVAQGYPPPYVLVGHSFGATYMELFAKAHPEEVAGLVLVEPRHRDFTATCEKESVEGCTIPASVVASLPPVQVAELDAFAQASPEIQAAGAFGSYPVRVLTATSHSSSPAWELLWRRMNSALAVEATNGEERVFDGAGHNLQLEHPHEVAETVLALVAAQP